MVKLQQYYIFKFNSARLKNSKYNIKINIKQARQNGEIVSIGESQMIRSLFKLQGKECNPEKIQELFRKKKTGIRYEVEQEIDKLLFIPEIVSVVIENNKHYQYIIDNGFFINNKKYVRLLCGSGQSRRNTVIFIQSDYEEPLKHVLNNGRNEDVEIAQAKFNAYFALCASATLPVSEPYFCVIKDCEITRKENVEFIQESDPDDLVVESEMELPFNLFDGMGIISPRQAEIWAGDMELDYIPSAFIIRNNFMKGMLAVIDFHRFSEEVVESHIIKDIWGNDVNIRDMDIILTESQLKLWNAFSSCQQYVANCRQNGLIWGVSRYTPKEDNKFVFSNYQFLQAQDLQKDDIESLCDKTVAYFSNIVKDDINNTLLYLLGKLTSEYDENILNKIGDPVAKALMLNNDLIHDPFIHNHIIRSINKKIKESYIGNLLLDGNYQIMISDPYAFMEHMFSLPVKGLLAKGEHYSHYWLSLNIDKVAAYRAPLTWRSEVNVLNLQNNDTVCDWYEYIKSGIIYNVHGVDNMIMADADQDGDLCMTTSQKELINTAYGGLPIAYARNKVPKTKIYESSLYQADMKSFNTRIGFITNCSTTMYTMLPCFDENSPEYNELINRLKICRKEQGNQIDKAKGLIVKPFPEHWTRWKKIDEKTPEEDVEHIKFNNSIIIDKRPYFMRWLYTNYNKKFKKFNDNYNNFCISKFNCTLEELFDKDILSEAEHDLLDKYHRFSPLLDSDCTMNRICHYMESKIKELKENNTNKASDHIVRILKNNDIPLDKDKLKALYNLYKKYKSARQNFSGIKDENGDDRFKTLDQYNKSVKQEASFISNDISELANLAVTICYEAHPSDNKSFAWNVFAEGIVDNIRKNKQKEILVPFEDKNGNIEFLGNSYTLREILAGDEFYDYLL